MTSHGGTALPPGLDDEVGPELTSLKLNFTVAYTLVLKDPAAAGSLILDLHSMGQSVNAGIRRPVDDLRQQALCEQVLIVSVTHHPPGEKRA